MKTNSRWLSLLVLCTGFLLIVVDMTIVNVALPSIQKDLGFSQSGLAWVVNAYLIAFGGLLLLAGRVGDLVGRKRVYLAGLVIFTSASVLCGLSFAQPMLIAARFVQGVGGAVSSAVILAMIVTLFPEPLERAKAFGVFSFVASAGAAVGLIAGGLITQAVSWHWIFFVNLPIGVATAVVSARLLAGDKGIGLAQGADVLGAVMVTAGLMLGVYAIVQTSAPAGAIALGLLSAFIWRQARVRNPMLPLGIFRSRGVAGANLVQGLMSTSFLGFFFLGSLDLERVQGYGPMAIGLAFMPVAVVMALFSVRFSAQLIGRFGAPAMLFAGLAVAGIALAAVALAPVHPNYFAHLMVPMALLGLGGGLSFPALTMIAMADVAPQDAGLASGLLNTTGQVGGAFGLAVLATVAAANGFQFSWAVCAVVLLVTLVIAMALLLPRRRKVSLSATQADDCAGRAQGALLDDCEAAA